MALYLSTPGASPTAERDERGPSTLPQEDEELGIPNDPEIDDENLDMDDEDDDTANGNDDPDAV